MKITPPEFCPISGNQDNLELPNLTGMYLKKYYWMLQNARVTAFSTSELLRGNQHGGKITAPSHPDES